MRKFILKTQALRECVCTCLEASLPLHQGEFCSIKKYFLDQICLCKLLFLVKGPLCAIGKYIRLLPPAFATYSERRNQRANGNEELSNNNNKELLACLYCFINVKCPVYKVHCFRAGAVTQFSSLKGNESAGLFPALKDYCSYPCNGNLLYCPGSIDASLYITSSPSFCGMLSHSNLQWPIIPICDCRLGGGVAAT